jgi:voltage-gated potassium channel
MVFLRLVRQLRRLRQHRSVGLATVLLCLSVSILGNSICFYTFESESIDDLEFTDALWYSVVSITTIGYGDYYPTTTGGRLGSFVFVILLGLGTFTVFLGIAIDWISDISLRERQGMSNIVAKDHIVIVNFPSASRVSQLVKELQSDSQHASREIVLVSDKISELPFREEGVLFVNGEVLERETYLRAQIKLAKMAIVLATSYEDSNSDAVVASAVSVINSLEPDIHIVAECLHDKHRMLFDSVHCDAIVFSMRISGNLLAQEVHDPGVSQLVDTITSNVHGTTLFSTEITEKDSEISYNEMAKRLLNNDINLICVSRNNQSLTSFVSISPDVGDRVIYAANRRHSWSELLGAAG